MQAGNGRGNRCESEDELLQRLDSDGVVHDASDLPAALSRLESGSLPGHPWQLIRPLELATVPVRSSPAVEALGAEVVRPF